jgi:DNA-3-methyladenine glycosylase I
MNRCIWANPNNELYVKYHDEEWGVPVHSDQKLFEFLVLESAQAGLSWETILKKREGYRKAFFEFDPHVVARMTEYDTELLLQNSEIVRNRLKIKSAITNAQAFLRIQQEYGSFNAYIWKWVQDVPIDNSQKHHSALPASTALSIMIAKDLKKRGFSFLGPTVCYAFMQAVGIVNDHVASCFRYAEINTMQVHQKNNL